MNPFEGIPFSKLTAAGNDFLCFSNLDGRFDAMIADPLRVGRISHALCRRGHGVGGDGVIFACQPDIPDAADLSARIFEWDGSEVELCGNGTASFTRWALSAGLLPNGATELRILTPAGVVTGKSVDGNYICVCVPLPVDICRDFEITAAGKTLACDFAITGIPHVVTYVDDLASVDVPTLGYALRHHEQFAPRGANANFVQFLGEGYIAMRTFEFGVEGETLACGTGSAASAILSAFHFGWGEPYTNGERPVRVLTRGGKELRVFFAIDETGHVRDLCLESPVDTVYTGQLSPDMLADIHRAEG
jgi:diaminopimelate epimerase